MAASGGIERGGVDYGEMGDDYAFFLGHSTETEAQVAALAPHLARLRSGPRPARLLDFGCGTGAFAERLLAESGLPPEALALWLVEPVDALREAAASRLARRAAGVHPVGTDALPRQAFDLVLANHSLYYVAEPETVVRNLLGALAPGGRLIAALLDRPNLLARLWRDGFGAAGMPFPLLLAEDIEAILAGHGARARRETVGYRIAFPDTAGNRRRVLRFLFGVHLGRLPPEAALALFDRHRQGPKVVIQTGYPHLVAESPV